MNNTNNMNCAGTYVLSAGRAGRIQVTVNEHGFVTACDDWEQMYAKDSRQPSHWGDKAEFFNGRIPNAKFFSVARKMY
jgi:hypothetical protein